MGRFQLDVVGLKASRPKNLRKHRIHPGDDRGLAPKVLPKLERRSRLSQLVAGPGIHLNVGPAESVDALFRIAYHKQLTGHIATQRHHNLALDRIGILKFVHQQKPVPLLELAAHRRIRAQ